jgi:hypothetical protein
MDFCRARDYIIQRLRAELKPTLYYHSVEHTLRFMKQPGA